MSFSWKVGFAVILLAGCASTAERDHAAGASEQDLVLPRFFTTFSDVCGAPVFTADGGYLFYPSCDETTGTNGVVRVDVKTGARKDVVQYGSEANVGLPQIGTSAGRVFWTTRHRTLGQLPSSFAAFDVSVRDVELATPVHAWTPFPETEPLGKWPEEIVVTPDGKHMAFAVDLVRGSSPVNRYVFVGNTDSDAELTKLPIDTSGIYLVPAPDSSHFLSVGGRKEGRRIDLAGAAPVLGPKLGGITDNHVEAYGRIYPGSYDGKTYLTNYYRWIPKDGDAYAQTFVVSIEVATGKATELGKIDGAHNPYDLSTLTEIERSGDQIWFNSQDRAERLAGDGWPAYATNLEMVSRYGDDPSRVLLPGWASFKLSADKSMMLVWFRDPIDGHAAGLYRMKPDGSELTFVADHAKSMTVLHAAGGRLLVSDSTEWTRLLDDVTGQTLAAWSGASGTLAGDGSAAYALRSCSVEAGVAGHEVARMSNGGEVVLPCSKTTGTLVQIPTRKEMISFSYSEKSMTLLR